MASLTNCQPVAAYTAEEFAGDTAYGAAALELQSPPAGAISSEAFPGFYYLVIESESGYHIKAENINIGGINGQILNSGSYQWNSAAAITGSVVPSDVLNIRATDSLADNTNCNNKVIIEVLLSFDFVMPANDHFINIDFGGTAQSCASIIIDTDFTYIAYELFINPLVGNTNELYIAKFFDAPLNSSPLPYNVEFPFNNGLNLYQKYWADSYSWMGTYFDAQASFPFTEPLLSPVDITTDCGALAISISTTQNYDDGELIYHPNYGDPNMPTNASGANTLGIPLNSTSSVNMPGNTVSEVDYPFLTPGDGVLPPYLCWYISMGTNPNYDLAASTEAIDVFKIVTTDFGDQYFFGEGSVMVNQGATTGGLNCEADYITNAVVLTSEKNSSGDVIENNSHLDIGNIEITQPDPLDNKTIKLKIPFQPNFINYIWDDSFPKRTKIFLNVYPNEI
tara:strand:- start:551 stop:1906 length:1356 start_codon:yes stop_codon:yes gene_type:complete